MWCAPAQFPDQWVVVEDATAASKRAIEQSSTDRTDFRFPLAIYQPVASKNVEVTIRFKPIGGRVDQAGGIAVRVTSPNDYYLVRANALENNVRFYRIVKGRRQQLATADIKVAPGEWHTLALKAENDRFTVVFNGKTLHSTSDWYDAKTYVAWLSRRTGAQYRLLSEAEWEYVARAGTTTPFWWGASLSTAQANYNGNVVSAASTKGEYRQQTLPVDSFEPNPWGLYQVHGNVYDWIEDCFNETYQGAPSDGSAWTTGDCYRRGHRGGSWFSNPWALRSAARNRNFSFTRFDFIGFRVARSLTR